MSETPTAPAPAKDDTPKGAKRVDDHGSFRDVWMIDPPGPGAAYTITKVDVSDDGRTRTIREIQIHED